MNNCSFKAATYRRSPQVIVGRKPGALLKSLTIRPAPPEQQKPASP
jgi:hypothetical protein